MIENKETGELEYDSSEIAGVEYTVITIDGVIITSIPSELKARGVQRRCAGSIWPSSDVENIKKLSNKVVTMTYQQYLNK